MFGRLWKVEELNWTASVYSTTTYSYNARDQLIQSNQKAESTQIAQLRSFAYDGHARLSSRTTPEQGTTSYNYNGDDTTNFVTDARGAKTIFGYNPRHLVTSITYDLSNLVPGQSVAATSNVSLTYDAAGNRKTMNDGLGGVTYNYDNLSQVTSEVRTFTGVSGSYTLSYAYNLVSELTSLTNQWGAVINYGYDKIGRVTGVTSPGVPTYASGLTYRAFGSIKGMSYGDGKSLSALYDNRMRPTRWEVGTVLGYNYNYDYFNEHTGRVTYAQNIQDPKLDRSYEYDHVGRLVISHSGQEARAHAYSGQWTPIDGPYSQGYEFDVWGNLTRRYGWGGEVLGGDAQHNSDISYGYTGNRRNGFSYDAAGNLTNDLGQTFTYDATGQQATAAYGGYSLQQNYDGDGLRAKKTENGAITYYLRSSVLGGQVVAEMSGTGVLQRSYIYLGGELLALKLASGSSYWVHEDPITKSKRVTDASGAVVSKIELDPWGATVSAPFSSNDAFQPKKFTSYERDGNGSDEAMFRRYNRWHSRFDQPDPYDGGYNAADPQTFNRYAYVQGDPVNFIDPTGLRECEAGDYHAECGMSGFGGWGWGYLGGNGWGSDPNPGREIIANGEKTYNNYAFRFLPIDEAIVLPLDFQIFGSWFGMLLQNLEGLDLWRAGVDELTKRIKENDDCAKFFGGEEKALKAIGKLKPQMGNLPSPAIAAINGNKVTLDSTRFNGAGTPVSVARFEKVEAGATYYATRTLSLSGAMFSAFAMGHELGHKTKSYAKQNDKDAFDPTKVGLNNEQLRAACFSELAAP